MGRHATQRPSPTSASTCSSGADALRGLLQSSCAQPSKEGRLASPAYTTKLIELGKRAYLLFDGDCGICTWFADVTMRIDVQRLFYIEPYQRMPEPDLQPLGLRHIDCSRRLQVITQQGKVHSGAF